MLISDIVVLKYHKGARDMSSILRISDAASMGIHAAAIMATKAKSPVSCKEMADALGVSEAHLSKVLQRLRRQELVRSARGPKGGFVLTLPAGEISLLDVYEAVDGPFVPSDCLLARRACNGRCIFGDLLASVNRQVREALKSTKLTDLQDFSLEGFICRDGRTTEVEHTPDHKD